MALLQVVWIFVFVFHNYIHCSTIPLILTARDSLTTEETKSVEIVTPIPNFDVVPEEEIISTQMPLLPSEIIPNPTDRSHFPTEMSTMSTKFTTLPSNENKTTQSSGNKIGNRIPKFFGRLAILAGLRLADELTNGSNKASSINFNSKDTPSPLTLNSPPTRVNPYFAAVYEPFSLSSQTYFYSNLLSLLPFLNPQKLPIENNPAAENLQNHQQTIPSPIYEADNQVTTEDFQEEYIPEHAKSEKSTIEKRIIEKAVLKAKKKNPPTEDSLMENTTLDSVEEESEDDEEIEESTEENLEPEESNVELFVPTTNVPSRKMNKIRPTIKPARQSRRTTKKPTKKPTVTPTSHPQMNNTTMNSTMAHNTTEIPVHNNTDIYPSYHGYYGGYPQSIHDLYITSSEHPPTHENYNYNEINPHFSEEWLSNRIPHESNFYSRYHHPTYEVPSHGEEEPILIDDPHSFRGSQVLEHAVAPELANNGFRPSFPF